MSLLEQISVKRRCLKNSDTILTLADGRRFLETKSDDGCKASKEIPKTAFGFVVDTKPDDTPAKVTEHLYLGSQDCCELNVIQMYNISRVLSIGIEAPSTYPHVKYKFVKCLDLPDTDVVEIVKDDCLEFIKDALESEKNVLVHCNAGVSRSSSVVIGYLMFVQHLSFSDAYDLVKSKRPSIKPNAGFEKQLRSVNIA